MKDSLRTRKSLLAEIERLRSRLAALEGRHGEKLAGSGLPAGGVLDCLPGLFYCLDTDWRLLSWNRRLEQKTGHDPGELADMTMLDLVAEDDRERMAAELERARGGDETYVEALLLTGDGSRVPYLFNFFRYQGDGDTRLAGMGLDVSDRKRADAQLSQALKESQQRRLETASLLAAARSVLEYQDFEKAARSIFDICKDLIGATSGYIALSSPDGQANELVFLDSGDMSCSVDESLPMPIRGLRGEVYRSGRAAFDNDFARSKWAELLPDGHVKLENVLFAPLSIKREPIGLLGIANKPGGFTEDDARLATAFGELAAVALLNDRTFQSLERSEEKYRSLTQSAGDAIVSADSHGRIISWNQAAERIFGYREEEVLGQPLTILMPDEFHHRHEEGMARFLETGEPHIIGSTSELTGRRRDGSDFPIELSLSSWSTKEGVFFTGVIRDISRRKRIEERELEARAKAQGFATRLSVLHEIGLALNRETDKARLLKTVLKGAAELTGAGLGVMTLVRDDRTEIISVYYAPWQEQRCGVGEEIPNLHRRLSRLVRDGADVARVDDTSVLEELPPGHLQLRGLLVGALRDTKGRVRGYFMLSDKHGGTDFTREDEEIISLLAAQSSVALASAETFEREHEVAQALQDALLPGALIRDDIEIGLLYQSSAPFGKVGGDFYDFVELEGSRLAVFVGDVCGKGLAAATYTAMIKYMLRAYLDEGYPPGECLTKLNAAVNKQVPIEKFVTLGLSIIDTGEALLTHASAGHPPPVLCRSDVTAPLEIKQAVPLGVISKHVYHDTTESLAGVCSLAMFTDGLLDARPEGGEPFGEKRLLEALAGSCCDPPQQVARQLVSSVIEYSRDNLRDDIALLVIRLLKHSSPL